MPGGTKSPMIGHAVSSSGLRLWGRLFRPAIRSSFAAYLLKRPIVSIRLPGLQGVFLVGAAIRRLALAEIELDGHFAERGLVAEHT